MIPVIMLGLLKSDFFMAKGISAFALTVMFGLAFSTILIMLLGPVFYFVSY
jgi:multidrug efflux pump subunit AcrB